MCGWWRGLHWGRHCHTLSMLHSTHRCHPQGMTPRRGAHPVAAASAVGAWMESSTPRPGCLLQTPPRRTRGRPADQGRGEVTTPRWLARGETRILTNSALHSVRFTKAKGRLGRGEGYEDRHTKTPMHEETLHCFPLHPSPPFVGKRVVLLACEWCHPSTLLLAHASPERWMRKCRCSALERTQCTVRRLAAGRSIPGSQALPGAVRVYTCTHGCSTYTDMNRNAQTHTGTQDILSFVDVRFIAYS